MSNASHTLHLSVWCLPFRVYSVDLTRGGSDSSAGRDVGLAGAGAKPLGDSSAATALIAGHNCRPLQTCTARNVWCTAQHADRHTLGGSVLGDQLAISCLRGRGWM